MKHQIAEAKSLEQRVADHELVASMVASANSYSSATVVVVHGEEARRLAPDKQCCIVLGMAGSCPTKSGSQRS